jgi:hypothetical protein
VPDYRDGRDKPGHERVEPPRVLLLLLSCLIERRASRHARIFISEQQTTSLIRAVDAPPPAGDWRGLR